MDYNLIGDNKIVIHKKSPYEILNSEELALLSYLRSYYPSWGADPRLSCYLHNFLTQCAAKPHVTALKLMYSSGDFYASKPNSLAVFIVKCYSNWLTLNPTAPPVESTVKLDALRLILEQKNTSLRDLVINAYDMVVEGETFLPVIEDLLWKKQFKEACYLVKALKLHHKFSVEDFLLPLFMQDKLGVIDDYLSTDKRVLIDFLTYMDNLLADDSFNILCEFAMVKEIPEWKLSRCSSKTLSKFIIRQLKNHKLSIEHCPNVQKHKKKAALHFLVAKRFETNEPCSEGWTEMALDAVGDCKVLQEELVQLIQQRGECEEAAQLARRFQLPESTLIPSLHNTEPKEKSVTGQCSSSVAAGLTEAPSFTLPFPDSEIILVDDYAQFMGFLDKMDGVEVVGIDAEWKPSFGMANNDLSLIQVATYSQVFILDRPALAQNVPQFGDALVDRLLHNNRILKLGFDLVNDLRALRSVLPGLKEVPLLLDLYSLRNILTEEYKFHFPHSGEQSYEPAGGKLKDLVALSLGKKLDKTEQFSNWERRPLRPSQLKYAALDAYCLLAVYDVIRVECKRQNIPLKDVIQGVPLGKPPTPGSPTKLPEYPTASDLHFICTWELCRLVKRLRRCGIDVVYNDSRYPSKKVVQLLTKNYICLTTVKQPWLTRELRSIKVPIADEKTQLHAVLTQFHVEVLPENINTRCPECNGTKFENISKSDFQELCDVSKASNAVNNYLPAEMVDADDDDDDDDDDDYDEYDDYDYHNKSHAPDEEPLPSGPSRFTSTGAVVQTEKVPSDVVHNSSSFSVCVECGAVLWPTTLEDMFLYD